MNFPSPYWSDWAANLRKNRLNLWLALLLDAAGPVNVVGAQLIHIAAPFLGNPAQTQSLANLLENDEETRAFIKILREK